MLFYFICLSVYWNGLIAIKITSRVEITLHCMADDLYSSSSACLRVPVSGMGLYKVPALAFLPFFLAVFDCMSPIKFHVSCPTELQPYSYGRWSKYSHLMFIRVVRKSQKNSVYRDKEAKSERRKSKNDLY